MMNFTPIGIEDSAALPISKTRKKNQSVKLALGRKDNGLALATSTHVSETTIVSRNHV
jgi:hypothetical protein